MCIDLPSSFEVTLSDATAMLGADEEIQAEVRRELRSHLADDYQSRLNAGQSPADAERETLTTFGEPTEVARQLHTAHRRRIAQRQAARWAMRLGVGPGAVALLVYFSAQIYLSLAVLAGLIAWSFQPNSNFEAPAIKAYVSQAPTAAVARFIEGPKSPAEAAAWLEPLAVERPDNLAVRRQLALARAYPVVNGQWWWNESYPDRPAAPRPTPEELDKTLAVLEEAKAADPGNGLYAIVEASVLFKLSTEQYTPPTGVPEPFTDWTDVYPYGKRFWVPEPYRVADPALYERGLAHLRELDAARFIDSGAQSLTRHWEDLAPPLKTIADRQARRQLELHSFASWFPLTFDVIRGADISFVHHLQSDPTQAKADAQRLAHIARLVSLGDPNEDEIGMAKFFYFQGLIRRAYAASEAQDRATFDWINAAKKQYDSARFLDVRHVRAIHNQRDAGWGVTDPYRLDPPPAEVTRAGLRAEYAMLDRFAVLVLAGTLLLAAAVRFVVRRDFTFKSLPRWRDAQRVILVTLVPAGLYLAASYLFPAMREAGLARTWPRLLAEYVLLCMATVLMLMFTLRSVLRRQGVRWTLSSSHLIMGLLLALGSSALICHWLIHPWVGKRPISLSELPVYLTILLLLGTLIYLVWTALRLLKFSPAYLLIPAFALLLFLTPTLRLIETHALSRSIHPAPDPFPNLKAFLQTAN